MLESCVACYKIIHFSYNLLVFSARIDCFCSSSRLLIQQLQQAKGSKQTIQGKHQCVNFVPTSGFYNSCVIINSSSSTDGTLAAESRQQFEVLFIANKCTITQLLLAKYLRDINTICRVFRRCFYET